MKKWTYNTDSLQQLLKEAMFWETEMELEPTDDAMIVWPASVESPIEKVWLESVKKMLR